MKKSECYAAAMHAVLDSSLARDKKLEIIAVLLSDKAFAELMEQSKKEEAEQNDG